MALFVFFECRRPEAVKKDQFSVFVLCGETATLPLDQISAVVDQVGCCVTM